MSQNATILVVDREKATLQLLNGILQAAGYEVLMSQDSADSLKILEQTEVDLVLIDEGLPESGGIAVAKKIMEIKPDTVVALMGICGTKRSALQEMVFGVSRHLIKPLEDQLLIRRVVEENLSVRKARLDPGPGLDDEDEDAENREGADNGPPVRVILADATTDEREEVRKALSQHSCEIKEATCAQEALLLISRGAHDVLVIGYDMGDMTADDVLLRARRLDDTIAVVVTATNPTLKMTTTLIKRGAAGFIEKPLRDPTRTAAAILRQGRDARDRRASSEEAATSDHDTPAVKDDDSEEGE